ncbi:MAG: GGDEF domain-containing protein [Epsilonproteobacteria bacterium]|nr:GGDEF domain-containing protein [Campylobacterota bacterium]
MKKQLKKLGFKDGTFPNGNLEKFIELVNTTYKEADEERAFLEHTLETSSQEMEELYEELKQKSQTALAKSEQRYKELATKDMLTGILNRFAFEDELQRVISNSKRTGAHFALLFLDLDHFKEVNDTYGHDIGDKLLQEAANRVLPYIRTEDVFARIGGDEFVLLFTNIKRESLPKLVNKTMSHFREPWIIDSIHLNVTTSIGVALFPDDADDKIKLMKKADLAMYRSKELGRNQVVFFENFLLD